MKALFLFVVLALGGCAFVDRMLDRRAPPDTRVVLKQGQELRINQLTRRSPLGASIDQYKCGDRQLMVCVDWGSDFICKCEVQ